MRKLPSRLFDIILLLLSGLVVLLIIFSVNKESIKHHSQEVTQNEPSFKYGIIIDSMLMVSDQILPGQSLSDIMTSKGLGPQLVESMASKASGVFDVRKMRSGNAYSLLFSNDSILQYFIYEESSTDFIVWGLADSIHVYRGQKDILKDTSTAAGVIETSLWNSLAFQSVSPNLALDLSEIYAWSIDFYGLQKGDEYKVIYERLYVDNQQIGIGRILAARFMHYAKDYYAFYYVQDSIGDYFDDQANSLRRTFLKAPLRFSRISSRFSHSRMHPILRYRRPHLGVDYAAPIGTPVQAIGDGIVIKASYSGGAGRMVTIKHNGTYSTSYLHLSKFGDGIKKGARVNQGDIIGYVGSSGLSTGPHLDFRFYRNGQAVDPLKVESPPAEPVDSSNLIDYTLKIEKLKMALDTIEIQ